MGFRETTPTNSFLRGQDIQVVRRMTSDVLEQAEAIPYWSQDYTQLGKGMFSGALSSVCHQGLQIFRETMNRAVDEIAHPPADSYVIGLPTIVDSQSHWGLNPLKRGTLITLNKNTELLFRTADFSEILVAVISAQRIEEYAALVEQVDFPHLMRETKSVEVIPPQLIARLQCLLGDGMCYMSKTADAAQLRNLWRHFEDDLMAACVRAVLQAQENRNHLCDCRVHHHIVARVRELTLEHVGCPMTIGELCSDLRISRRTLNHAFARVLGITPVAYMRNVRLHRVRKELQSIPDEVSSIADLASRLGFWHMSLFSRYYRELFGERPIETWMRAKQGQRRVVVGGALI